MSREPSLVDARGNEVADTGVHPTRDVEQDAPLWRRRRVILQGVVKTGEAGFSRVHALDGLGQLHLVADQH